MLKKAECNLLIYRVILGQYERDLEHAKAVERHPRRAIRLIQVSAAGQRGAAIENTDVVQPQEAAREYVASVGVLAVHPPVEVQHQSLEGALQKAQIGPA